jgi:outer membrane protein TolC
LAAVLPQEAEPVKFSLEEAISYSIEHSLAVDDARIKNALGAQSVAEGVGGLLPRLSASSSTSDSSLADLGDGMWSSQFSLSQPVVDATAIFGLIGGIQQNGVSRAQARQTIAQLILDVQNAYYNLAASQALVASADGQYTRARENLRIVSKRFELGDASKADKLRAEASLLSAEMELLQARTFLESNQRILSDLVGFAEWKSIETEELSAAQEPYSLPTTLISAAILADNPDFDVLRRQVKATDLTYWGAWASILPSLSLTASKGFAQSEVLPSFSDWEEESPNYGLVISFPIADLKGKILSINRARLERKNSRVSLARQELSFRERLAALLATQSSSYKGWEVASKNVELSNEVYRLSVRSYELGAISLADLLVVEAELVQAERALVKAKADYWSSRAELNYFLGTSMED